MPTAVTPLAPIPSTRAPTDNDHEVDLGATTLELLGRGEAHLDLDVSPLRRHGLDHGHNPLA